MSHNIERGQALRALALMLPLAVPVRWAIAQPAIKPLRIIIPFTPGGSTEILARAIGPRIALPGQSVLIDNKPGAGGSLDADIAAMPRRHLLKAMAATASPLA